MAGMPSLFAPNWNMAEWTSWALKGRSKEWASASDKNLFHGRRKLLMCRWWFAIGSGLNWLKKVWKMCFAIFSCPKIHWVPEKMLSILLMLRRALVYTWKNFVFLSPKASRLSRDFWCHMISSLSNRESNSILRRCWASIFSVENGFICNSASSLVDLLSPEYFHAYPYSIYRVPSS